MKDTLICKIGDHKVMRDSKQFVLWHPGGCKNRGIGGKTFYGHWMLDDLISDCRLTASSELITRLEAISEDIRERVKKPGAYE